MKMDKETLNTFVNSFLEEQTNATKKGPFSTLQFIVNDLPEFFNKIYEKGRNDGYAIGLEEGKRMAVKELIEKN